VVLLVDVECRSYIGTDRLDAALTCACGKSYGAPVRSVANSGTLHLAGSGSFAVEVADWAQAAGWHVAGLLELRDRERIGSSIDDLPVLDAELLPAGEAWVVLAIGADRHEHWQRLKRHGWRAASVVHPRAYVSSSARLGDGCVVGPGATVGARTQIGEHALISRGVLLGHHDRIGPFVRVFPGANVAGNVRIGEGTQLGMGAMIVNGVSVGREATIAAGAVVVGDVADGVRMQGVPAREYAGR
jgi:acetyltransferase EpsM